MILRLSPRVQVELKVLIRLFRAFKPQFTLKFGLSEKEVQI
jgi:hypothetical protein